MRKEPCNLDHPLWRSRIRHRANGRYEWKCLDCDLLRTKRYRKSKHGAADNRNWQRFFRAGMPTSEKHRALALERGEIEMKDIVRLTR